MPRILFQRIKCIGCNACVEAAPQRWRVSTKDGRCNLVGSIEKKGIHQVAIHLVELEDNQKAAENCPMRIIQVTER